MTCCDQKLSALSVIDWSSKCVMYLIFLLDLWGTLLVFYFSVHSVYFFVYLFIIVCVMMLSVGQ
jgi:hypothetical protein